MGRPNISEVGKKFSTEYQPTNRGRKKGQQNYRTILRDYLRVQEPPTPEQQINQLLDAVFGKKRARRVRRKLPPLPASLTKAKQKPSRSDPFSDDWQVLI